MPGDAGYDDPLKKNVFLFFFKKFVWGKEVFLFFFLEKESI